MLGFFYLLICISVRVGVTAVGRLQFYSKLLMGVSRRDWLSGGWSLDSRDFLRTFATDLLLVYSSRSALLIFITVLLTNCTDVQNFWGRLLAIYKKIIIINERYGGGKITWLVLLGHFLGDAAFGRGLRRHVVVKFDFVAVTFLVVELVRTHNRFFLRLDVTSLMRDIRVLNHLRTIWGLILRVLPK